MFFSPIDPATIDALATRWGALALTVTWKGFVLLLLALALHAALRRGAASARHLVWTGALVGLLMLPLLGAALPPWEIPGLRLPTIALETTTPEATATPALPPTTAWITGERIAALSSGVPNAASAPRVRALDASGTPLPMVFMPSGDASTALHRPFGPSPNEPTAARDTSLLGVLTRSVSQWSAWTWALMVWELGVLLVVGWLSLGWWHLRNLQRRSEPLTDAHWQELAQQVAGELGMRRVPKLVRTRDAMTPLTWGVLHPVVLIPAPADAWSEAQRIDVLRHEFAHVQRRDVLTQFLAQITCALMWFHPLPWIAAARMRLERERACDDRVLLAGSRASSYAGHLLDMARSLRSEHSLAAATIGMARRSQLGERMDSLLDDAPRARRIGRLARFGLCALLLALLVPLAAMRPQAAPADAVSPRFPNRIASGVEAPRVVRVATPRPPRPPLPGIPRAVAVAPHAGAGFGIRSGISLGGDLGHSSSSYEVDTRQSNFSLRSDGVTLDVELDGRMRFAQDESDIEWMEAGAYFELERREGRDRRRMEIEAERDGELERSYFVGGRRTDFDDEARAWFAAALAEFMVHSGIGAEPRLQRWLEDGGVDNAIEEVSAIEGDYAAARHWSVLLGMPDLDSDDRAKVLTALPRALDSDFEKVSVLRSFPPSKLTNERSQRAFLEALRNVDSDFERGRGLAVMLDGSIAQRHAPLVMSLVDDFDSDFEKARVLVQALPLALDDAEARQTMWRSIEAMDSDFEKARVIGALVDKIDHDEIMLIEALDVCDSIDSDFEKGRVLRHFAQAAAKFPKARERYVAVAEELGSDHEYGQAMRALQRADR